ncbi:CoA transferase subunit A [Paenibacillus puerhi]|uniref:CoA transferase subunit A n=1 Tax=Paenibacillus puerhi TaxID=2692622 RepID=UPI00135A1C8B|nr:CoA-transferase [Paenibacillus puerhi]
MSRGAASKIVSLPEAVGRIPNGASVAVSGNMEMSPMALIREVIRAGKHDLALICSGAAAMNADMLIGSGLVSSVEFSQIAMGEFGFGLNFRRAFERGSVTWKEHACPSLAAALQAGAMGIPFIPVRGLLGTDYMRIRSDFHVLTNPYVGQEEIAVVPALRPDAALFHGYKADTLGNVIASPSQNNRLLAQASAFTIASVEELVSPEELRLVQGSFIPSIYVSAVVVAPGGAWPTACPGYYGIHEEHVRLYMEAARSEEAFSAYLARYAAGSPDEGELDASCGRSLRKTQALKEADR